MAYPLAVHGKLIGFPYQGTHTLGNWQSDNAVDISVPIGTPVFAVVAGTIGSNIGSLGAAPGSRFAGLRVQVNGKGNSYWYGHLSKLDVHAGQHVKEGEQIGLSGSANGVSHLHFAAQHGDPRNILGGSIPSGGDPGSGAGDVAGKDVNWKPCLLTWYDPALGGINSSHGQADPHALTASGEPYNASAFTCAAPPAYKFGTRIAFRYKRRIIVCKVNDRGGQIIGSHFDLSRIAKDKLGISSAMAEFAVVSSGTALGGDSGYGLTRPDSSADATKTDPLEDLFQNYMSEFATNVGQVFGQDANAVTAATSGGATAPNAAPSTVTPGITTGAGESDTSIIPGVPTGFISHVGPVPLFNPLAPFEDAKNAIDGVGTFLKYIAWIFHPRNVLRVVQFLVGLETMVLGIVLAVEANRSPDAPERKVARMAVQAATTAAAPEASAAGGASKASSASKTSTSNRTVTSSKTSSSSSNNSGTRTQPPTPPKRNRRPSRPRQKQPAKGRRR